MATVFGPELAIRGTATVWGAAPSPRELEVAEESEALEEPVEGSEAR